MRIPILERLPKVFTLSTPQHLLGKLRWEVAGFKRAEASKHRLGWHLTASYHAANCAITAWHMTDWIWQYLGEQDRRDLAEALGVTPVTLPEFQAYVRNASRALNCCRDIATGSKHMKLTRPGADPDVDAKAEWGHAAAKRGKAEPVGTPASYTTHLLVTDRQGTRPAREIFEEAFTYWDAFMLRNGLIEDRSITIRTRRVRRR